MITLQTKLTEITSSDSEKKKENTDDIDGKGHT